MIEWSDECKTDTVTVSSLYGGDGGNVSEFGPMEMEAAGHVMAAAGADGFVCVCRVGQQRTSKNLSG